MLWQQRQRCGNKPAQGNALGSQRKNGPSPERAGQFGPPFQGSSRSEQLTQGVALGWLDDAPLVRRRGRGYDTL